VADALVHHSAGQAVAAPVPLPAHWEEAGIVSLLNHHKGDGGAVVGLKLKACLGTSMHNKSNYSVI
jgi:hypothetical protein